MKVVLHILALSMFTVSLSIPDLRRSTQHAGPSQRVGPTQKVGPSTKKNNDVKKISTGPIFKELQGLIDQIKGVPEKAPEDTIEAAKYTAIVLQLTKNIILTFEKLHLDMQQERGWLAEHIEYYNAAVKQGLNGNFPRIYEIAYETLLKTVRLNIDALQKLIKAKGLTQ